MGKKTSEMVCTNCLFEKRNPKRNPCSSGITYMQYCKKSTCPGFRPSVRYVFRCLKRWLNRKKGK